jgi:2,4-dienoyl-CoA reductase-like NADH-dependent reductase (Old Yellow Enzyme family)
MCRRRVGAYGDEMPDFPLLFSPLAIGPVELRNRIFSAGHDTTLATDGYVNDALVAYHEARARGGAGLIIIQVAGVHESARYTSHLLMATDDRCIAGYRRLADTLHRHHSVVFGQLFHPGREIMESQDGHAPVAYSASAAPSERFGVTPRPLTTAMISEIIAGYAAAARRLAAAGLDGVEIVASHGYLPAQFLSPRINQRDDAYGSDRLRFLSECVTAVRNAVPRGVVVGLRISGDEHSADGLRPDETLAACVALNGMIDYVNVTAGSSATLAGSVHIVPPMMIGAAYTAPLAGRIRSAVTMPVLVGGRINQPQDAERVLAAGQADAVGMTRALICDPQLPAKARAGAVDEIRACIACNQACIGHFHLGYPISCVQRPETGRELEYGTLTATTTPRRVMIIGGGPAGLKAASVAAARGHHVTLYEAAGRVGGQALLAERLPGRGEFGGIVTNLEGEARRAGAVIRTGVRISTRDVHADAPDVVIVASGARPRRPALEVLGDPVIVDAWQVLAGGPLPPGRVVVADWRCDWIGPGVATLLAAPGRRVTLAVAGYMPGQRIQQYVRDMLLADLHRARVEVVTLARLVGVDDDTVYFQHATSGEPILIGDTAALVLAQGHEAVDAMLHSLDRYHGSVEAVGDCVSPRTAEEAVLEGLRAAARI